MAPARAIGLPEPEKGKPEKGTSLVSAPYAYDGLNRRIKKHADTDAPADPDGVDTYVHYFYNASWRRTERPGGGRARPCN